ncbi:hypothetical protein [Anaerocellum danielii]|nr:hypothetical protein [Caldicellulosiruptor danielii]
MLSRDKIFNFQNNRLARMRTKDIDKKAILIEAKLWSEGKKHNKEDGDD